MEDGGDGRGDEFGPLADQYLVSLAGTATSIISVATKSLVVTNTCLSRQSTSFVATKECLFCRDKYVFICHDILLSRQKTFFCCCFLSRQTSVCRDKKEEDTCGSSRQRHLGALLPWREDYDPLSISRS